MLSLRMLVMLRLLGCHLHWQASHHLPQRRHFWRPIHDHEGEVHCCRLAPVVMHIVILTHDESGRRWPVLDLRVVHTVSSTSTWRGLAHTPPCKSSSATPWAQVLGQRRKSVGTKICSISSMQHMTVLHLHPSALGSSPRFLPHFQFKRHQPYHHHNTPRMPANPLP
jgi:hypothetical protein